MKKVLIILLYAVLLSGCGGKSVISDSETKNKMETIFERHRISRDYSILVDKENGVCYFEKSSGYYYGITIMVNPDGTPKLWEGFENDKD